MCGVGDQLQYHTGTVGGSRAFGVKAAVIYASGFSEENTEEGIALEEKVKEIARKYDMCICGPNCMGMLNNVDKVNMWGGHTHWDLEDDAHGIAIIAQSGFICAEILNTDFFNISYAVSSGNGILLLWKSSWSSW